MIEILMTRLDVGSEAAREAAALLSDGERRRAAGFSRNRDSLRFIVTRAELRRQLGARLQVPARQIEFASGPHGKPCLGGGKAHDLHFSVSHSDDVAALAFATEGEIGVDIEVLRAVPDAETIAAQFCSPEEWRAYASLTEHQKLRGFLAWWTRREAFVKAHGGGLSHPLDPSGAAWTVRPFAPGPGLVGAIAYATDYATGGETRVTLG